MNNRSAFIAALLLSFPRASTVHSQEFFGSLDAIRTQALNLSASSMDPQDRLLELTKDPDAAVRLQAVRSLQPYLNRYEVKDRVFEILADAQEQINVREEAARDLSLYTNDYEADNKLIALAKDTSAPGELRAFAMKALYNAAVFQSDARSYLQDEAKGWGESDLGLRLAATWGLFQASQNDSEVRETLLNGLSTSQDVRLRVESIKSLFRALNDYSVKSKLLELAQASDEDPGVRYAATLALSAAINDYNVRSVLEALSGSDQAADLRRAATLAMGDPNNPEILCFFHAGYVQWPAGAYVNPLDCP